MCDPVSATVAVTAASGGVGAYESREARKSAEREAARQRSVLEQQRMATERQQAAIEERQTNAATVAQAAQRRRRQSAGAATGRRDTILTGPMGILGQDVSKPISTILGG